MLANLVDTRATTATRARCARRGLGRNTLFARLGGSIPAAEKDPRPGILQLKTEELTASKNSVTEQLAYKNNALVIFLQETHCTTADKLVIPNLSLAGSVSAGLTTVANVNNCFGPRGPLC